MEDKKEILQEIASLDENQANVLLRNIIIEAGINVGTEISGSKINEKVLLEAFGQPTDDNTDNLEKQTLKVFAMDPVMEDFLTPAHLRQACVKPLHFFIDPNSLITTTTLALLVLSTYIHIKKDGDGKWTFEFRIKNSSESLKKELIKLAQRLAGGGTIDQ